MKQRRKPRCVTGRCSLRANLSHGKTKAAQARLSGPPSLICQQPHRTPRGWTFCACIATVLSFITAQEAGIKWGLGCISAVHHVFVLGHHRGESSDWQLIAVSSARFVAQALRLFRGGEEVLKLVQTATIGALHSQRQKSDRVTPPSPTWWGDNHLHRDTPSFAFSCHYSTVIAKATGNKEHINCMCEPGLIPY